MSEIDDQDAVNDGLIQHLINKLSDPYGLEDPEIREQLVKIGRPAVPFLIKALTSPSDHLRWEAVFVLGEIGDPIAAEALIAALQDENIGVRWMAMDSLTMLGQAAIPPLLLALGKDFGSVRLREGAHHILHVLKDREHLPASVIKVFDALESIEPDMAVPWAVEGALEEYGMRLEK